MIYFLLTLVLIGVGLYLVNTVIPMDSRIKTVINVVVLVLVLFFVLNSFGLIPAGSLPHLRY